MLCCNWSERIVVFPFMVLPAIFVFSYGKYRSVYPMYKDPLMNKLGIWNLDYWSLTHFIWYGLSGYLFPECDLIILGCGLVWEGFEHWMGQARPAILGGFGDCPENVNAKNNEKWWYGRGSDLIMNTLGFYICSYLF